MTDAAKCHGMDAEYCVRHSSVEIEELADELRRAAVFAHG